MTISVVVVVHNKWSLTYECLKKLEQNEIPFELILVDNASTEKAPYSNGAPIKVPTTMVLLQKNIGLAAGWNAGLKLAKGKYIAFVSNDAIVPNHYLSRMVEQLEKDPQLGVVSPSEFHHYHFFPKEMHDTMGEAREKCKGIFEEMKGSGNWSRIDEMLEVGYGDFNKWNDAWYEKFKNWRDEHVSASSWVIRREVFDKLKEVDRYGEGGLFDENYLVAQREDSDFTHRVEILAKYKVRASGSVFVHHFGSLTVGEFPNMPEVIKKNTDRFKRKWGYEPFK